jgi:TonB-linked SusC/RagA family outer membrane protein
MNRYIKIIVTILSLNLLFLVSSLAQDQKTVVVKDESGNPVASARVTIGENVKPVITNEKGEFVLTASNRATILIKADGFESQIVKYSPALPLENVILIKMPFQMSEKDIVDVPFGTMKKRQITGAIKTLVPDDILLYDQQGSINGILNGRIPGLFGSSNIRGIGSPMYVVDGVARPIASLMNLHDVKQISVLKDMSTAMLYGSQATNGVIFITTKRGEPMKKTIRLTAERGMNKPISYPNYLKAADYMTLYNEALANDGLSPKYTSTQIDGTAGGIDPIRYPDEDYYNSTYLKDWSGYHKLNSEISGGNDIAQFFVNVGWDRTNSLLKIGNGADEKNDRFSIRGNINYDITDKIKLIYDGSVIFDITRGPRYTTTASDFWVLSSTLHPEYYPVLIPLNLLNDNALKRTAKPVNDNFILGGTSEFQTNIYGELTKNGTHGTTNRLLEMTTGLDFDLGSITQGLMAKVYLSFDMYNQYIEDILNSYAVYNPVYATNPPPNDTINAWNKYKTDVKVASLTLSDAYYYRRYGFFGTLDYNRIFGDHEIKAVALAYRDEYSVESVLQNLKHLHFGVRANYMFKNKYIAELTGVYAGSVKLFEAERWAFSPGIGLGWVLTEESFLKGNSLVNYLKVRGSWALNKTDEALNYKLGRDYYTGGSSFSYSQGTFSNTGRNIFIGNPSLKWEKIMNYSLGFESMILNYNLGIEGSYFYNKYYDVITQRTNSLPSFFGNLPYENFGSFETKGVELGLNYNASFGDLQVSLGANFVYSVPKVLAMNELNYLDSYRKNTGKATDAMFGLVALGLFKDQADIDNSVFQTFGAVRPGDIKYKDLNQDGLINDDDQTIIGNSRARTEVGINVRLKYKSFEAFALGTGQNGQERYFNNSYYWVYGDRKYSEVVLNRWTPETASSATYPKLSSSSNANNFRNSTFWIYKTDWFTLQTVQLTYALPGRNFAGLDEVRFFLRGSNLATISKTKDKTQLNIGTQPQMRSFSIGLSLLF